MGVRYLIGERVFESLPEASNHHAWLKATEPQRHHTIEEVDVPDVLLIEELDEVAGVERLTPRVPHPMAATPPFDHSLLSSPGAVPSLVSCPGCSERCMEYTPATGERECLACGYKEG